MKKTENEMNGMHEKRVSDDMRKRNNGNEEERSESLNLILQGKDNQMVIRNMMRLSLRTHFFDNTFASKLLRTHSQKDVYARCKE